MKKYPGYDIYVMVVTCINVSHAGGKVAHMRGFLLRDGQHEVGHLLGLEHAGAYINGSYEAYGDALSVMGKFPSGFLSAPQYVFKGWFPQKEIATYPANSTETKTFTLKRLTNFASAGLSTVACPRKEGGTAYISYPQSNNVFKNGPYLALHLGVRGGSRKIKAFNGEFYDSNFTGLHIKVLNAIDGNITFSIDYAVRPSEFVEEKDVEDVGDDRDGLAMDSVVADSVAVGFTGVVGDDDVQDDLGPDLRPEEAPKTMVEKVKAMVGL